LEATIVPPAGYRLDRLWLRSLRTVDLSIHLLLDPLRLMVSLPQALALLGAWRPQAVFTTGGYVAIPVLAAAAALRIPSLLWEGNLVAGRSVRATARLASAIAVSFEETLERLPRRPYVTGTPIRSFAGIERGAARGRLGVPADVPCLLVFGGSQGVRRLNDAVNAALPALIEKYAVVHVCGEAGLGEARALRASLPAQLQRRYAPFAYLADEMTDALVAADLLVGRAGSSTLAEATALGLPLVVVPYPHAGAHQLANARRLAETGAARIIPDEQFSGPALLEAAAVLDDPIALGEMQGGSRSFARPGAAEAVAELLAALAERRPLPDAATIEHISRASP